MLGGRPRSFRRRGFAAFGKRPRKALEWATFASGQNTTASGSTTIQELVSEVTINTMNSPTLMRIRGSFLARIAAVANPGDALLCAIGIQVVEAVQTTQIESPTLQGNSSRWLYLAYQYLEATDVAGLQTVDAVTGGFRLEIDARGRRKVSERDRIVMVVENTAVAGTPSLRFETAGRSLLMEPTGR